MPSLLGFWILMKEYKMYAASNRDSNRTLQDRAYYRRTNSSVLVQAYDDGMTFISNYFSNNITTLPDFKPNSPQMVRRIG